MDVRLWRIKWATKTSVKYLLRRSLVVSREILVNIFIISTIQLARLPSSAAWYKSPLLWRKGNAKQSWTYLRLIWMEKHVSVGTHCCRKCNTFWTMVSFTIHSLLSFMYDHCMHFFYDYQDKYLHSITFID